MNLLIPDKPLNFLLYWLWQLPARANSGKMSYHAHYQYTPFTGEQICPVWVNNSRVTLKANL